MSRDPQVTKARTARGQGLDQPLTAPLTPFVDALLVPRRLIAAEHQGQFTVRIQAATHRFHRDLPESRIWGYDGTVPGPTIEAERGKSVMVEWRNELEGPLPVMETVASKHAYNDGIPVQCLPGLSGGTPDPRAGALSGHAVVHLHGGLTPAPYDGWAENLFAPGQPAFFHYPMNQRAALLWYHDHVMGVIKFDVYAGLAGQLVHKTDPEVMEAFAPFTVVNGKVWPILDVQPATYRFRVINGSNARTYRLVLLGDGDSELERVIQIGTDHGLLPTPVRLPSDGLVLASAERADLLVDFSDLDPGSELILLNTASAPFDGASFPAARALEAASLDGLLPFPQTMCFRVIPGPSASRSIPTVLATDYVPPPPEELADAPRRAIALVERGVEGQANMLTMRELRIVEDDHTGPLVTVTNGERITRYRAVAAHFEDVTTFFPVLGQFEVWQLINLTGDTHPIHVHLDPFQILARHPMRYQIPDAGIEDLDITASVIVGRDPDDELSHAIDDNERGLKDTIRVNPNEIVEIAVRFTTYSGRYMYHCHILEHEDRDMMRPFVTMPAELMPFMA